MVGGVVVRSFHIKLTSRVAAMVRAKRSQTHPQRPKKFQVTLEGAAASWAASFAQADSGYHTSLLPR